MKCLNCEGEKFERKNVRFTPEVKGEEVEVVVPAFCCIHCETPLMNNEQMNTLRRAAADRYRRTHHLLTSEEIVLFRTQLGLSQTAFANYLKVGEASIKRWETYFVQDAVQDDHIRLKCDEAYAELNALQVHWKCHPPDIFSGYRRFSLELFKQAIRYLIGFTKSPLFLNKALFYADFKHFQLHGQSITGARYVHLDYGPCPDQYQNLYQLFLKQGLIAPSGHHSLKSKEKPDLSVFSDTERATLEFVAKLTQPDSGKALFDLSHEEKAFQDTQPLRLISYALSESLKI